MTEFEFVQAGLNQAPRTTSKKCFYFFEPPNANGESYKRNPSLLGLLRTKQLTGTVLRIRTSMCNYLMKYAGLLN
jgi:hypothetical protein